MNSLARLQPNMRVLFQGEPHRVVMVNECRARIVAERRLSRTIIPTTGANAGKPRTILEQPEGHNISPNAELEILAGG